MHFVNAVRSFFGHIGSLGGKIGKIFICMFIYNESIWCEINCY